MQSISDNFLWNRTNKLFGRPREKWNTIDEMIYNLPNYFYNDIKKIEKMRYKSIKESISHHFREVRLSHQWISPVINASKRHCV